MKTASKRWGRKPVAEFEQGFGGLKGKTLFEMTKFLPFTHRLDIGVHPMSK